MSYVIKNNVLRTESTSIDLSTIDYIEVKSSYIGYFVGTISGLCGLAVVLSLFDDFYFYGTHWLVYFIPAIIFGVIERDLYVAKLSGNNRKYKVNGSHKELQRMRIDIEDILSSRIEDGSR